MPCASRPAVEVEAAEPERIGARAAPVDALEIFAARTAPVLQREIAVLQQPRVQIDAAPEGAEAVIGEHEQRRVRIDTLPMVFADQAVHAR